MNRDIDFQAFGRDVVAQGEAIARDDVALSQAIKALTDWHVTDLDATYRVKLSVDETGAEILCQLLSDAPRYVAPVFGA